MRSMGVCLWLLVAACGGGSRAGEPGVDASGGVRSTPGPGHFCSDNCGHFMHRGLLYHIDNHTHGSDCGHHKINGIWYYAKPVSGSGCKHTSYCGHYKYQGSWYYVADHVHSNGCGHLYRNGEWFLE